MADWDAKQYLKFEDERTRAARDLLAQIDTAAPRRVYDLGCGPGNSTELLRARFAGAEIVGLDSSSAMLKTARAALPDVTFLEADLTTWTPEAGADVLFANAVFQWLPNHSEVLQKLFGALAPGAVLAVQMPDNLTERTHALMSEVGEAGPWAARLAGIARQKLPPVEAYYDLLAPLSAKLDIWHSVYNHVLADAAAIVAWVQGTGLRPFLAPLDAAETKDFLATYEAAVARAYPPRVDGKVLLRFPRLFIVATRA